MTYDPFAPGPDEVTTRTLMIHDGERDRAFPCDVWEPAGREAGPLLVYSHSSGGNRLSSTFLTRHLASHGYRVAAMDHSERVVADIERPAGVIASRVPDLRLLLDRLGTAERVGLVGHSFGGWSVLATTEVDERVRAVVAIASGATSPARPGILDLTLRLDWWRTVATLYLAADADVLIPLDRIQATYERTPPPKRMWVLRRADHQHFVDDAEGTHEALRTEDYPPDLQWIADEMVPFQQLATAEVAHAFARGLTLAHFDAELRDLDAARDFWAGDVEGALRTRGIDAFSGSS